VNTLQLTVPLPRTEWWPLHPDDYRSVPVFLVGTELELDDTTTAVVQSWDLATRQLVVSLDCWDANGAPV
jgi:hypothetical protein